MTVRELLTKWKVVVDDKSLNKLDKQIQKTKKNFDSAGKSAVKFGGRLTTFVTLPLAAASTALVKIASDAQEGASKFGTIFRDIDKQAEATANSLRKNFGLSRAAAKELLGDTGDLLTGFGFTQESALDLSNQVQELAVDLASFTNFTGGAAGASKAITKALLGERESIKSLGKTVLEEDVKRRVALNTTKGMTFETERQAKAIATLQIIQEQSKNAIGDFSRTNKEFAARMRIAKARANDLAVSFGNILLPPTLKLLNSMISLLETLDEMSPEWKSFIINVARAVAVIGPLLLAFGVTVKMISLIKDSFKVAKLAMKAFTAQGALTALLIVAAFLLIFLIAEDLLSFFQGKKSVFGLIVHWLDKVLLKFQNTFPKLSKIVLSFVAGVLSPIKAVLGVVRGLAGALGSLFGGGGFGGAGQAFKEEFLGAFSDVKKLTSGGKVGLQDILGIGGLRKAPLVAPPPEAGAAGASNKTTNINVSSPITVPPGTPPELVGSKVKEGVMEVLGRQMRDTQQSVEPQVAF